MNRPQTEYIEYFSSCDHAQIETYNPAYPLYPGDPPKNYGLVNAHALATAKTLLPGAKLTFYKLDDYKPAPDDDVMVRKCEYFADAVYRVETEGTQFLVFAI